MNRTVKTTLALLALATLVSLPVLARPGARGQADGGPGAAGNGGPGKGHRFAGRILGAAAEYLGLTEEQRTAARQIFQDARTAAQPIREQIRPQAEQLRTLLDGANPDAAAVGALVVAIDAQRDQLRAIREGAMDDLRALLTPEQQAQLDTFRAVLETLRPGHRGGPEGDDEEEEG
jgi:Spy/CpxP family protein refolding chaperone